MINFLMDKLYNILKMYRSANKNSIFNRIMKKSYNCFLQNKKYMERKNQRTHIDYRKTIFQTPVTKLFTVSYSPLSSLHF